MIISVSLCVLIIIYAGTVQTITHCSNFISTSAVVEALDLHCISLYTANRLASHGHGNVPVVIYVQLCSTVCIEL